MKENKYKGDNKGRCYAFKWFDRLYAIEIKISNTCKFEQNKSIIALIVYSIYSVSI